ncbi:MAG: transporter related protein [Frankiales bacterium]|nr:transporter related protein [Frankiales bacterium]
MPSASALLGRHGSLVLLLALVLVVPVVADDYYLGLGATVGVQALLAMGLILVTGLAGQFSLAQAGFFGIGAYGSALLTVQHGWPHLAAAAASAAVATGLAYALGKPIFRLRGHYLAMGTLALTQILYLLANNLSFTGGSSGFGGVEPFALGGGLTFDTLREQFWLTWAVLLVALWGCLRAGRSREGRALQALGGHEAAASACGVNVSWSKTRVFAASAFIGSIAGSLYAHQLLYVNPAPFDVFASVGVLTVAVLGGLRSPWGAILGAVGYEALRQGIDKVLPGLFGEASVGAGQALVLGVMLVLVLVLRPDGFVGLLGAVAGSVRRWYAARTGRPAQDRAAPAPGDHATARPVPSGRSPMAGVVLEAEGLSKHFGGVKALDGVDLTLHAGEILAVIGPNGAGKSTLMNVLSGNLPATSGNVTMLGKALTRQPPHRVAALGLARTFQTPSLFAGMTVHENVLVGAYRGGKVGLIRSAVPTLAAAAEERRLSARVDGILERLGIVHLASAEATLLSLGQQKMVEIARALAQEPQVLLLDEPGAGLNLSEKADVAVVLRELRASGMALVLIEHDMDFVMQLADRVQVLVFGETLLVGPPEVVQSSPDVVAAYLGTAPAPDAPVEVADVRA